MDVDGGEGITEAIKAAMTDKSVELSKGRKKREPAPTLATQEEVGGYKQKHSFPVHLSNAVTCIDAHKSNANTILTGGADNKVVLFDISSGKQSASMEGHTKTVNQVLMHPTKDMCFSASADKTVRAWSNGQAVHTWKHHSGNVTGISLHATGDYLVSASMDSTWSFMDLATGTCRKSVQGEGAGFSAGSFHPDGLILGTGKADGVVAIWDVKTQQNVVTFSGHSDSVSSISFSENGYYLATW
jgi:pre-mRNA-processing factor 19